MVGWRSDIPQLGGGPIAAGEDNDELGALDRRGFLLGAGSLAIGAAFGDLLIRDTPASAQPSKLASALSSTSPTWPTLPAFSSNNFVDHFDAASLDRGIWTAVTTGSGAVSVNDSCAVIDAPPNSAAFLYRNLQIDKSKSQLWLICLNSPTVGSAMVHGQGACLHVMNGASPPAPDVKANVDAKTLIRRAFANRQALAILDWYYAPSGGPSYWDGLNSGWTPTYANTLRSLDPVRANDYYVFGIEIDGLNARWRLLGWAQSFLSPGTWTSSQGWRLFALTDWVNWSNTRANSQVWLVIGHPFTDTTAENKYLVEWVRYAEAPAGNTVVDAWAAGKSSLAATPQIRHLYSYDGQVFVPQDRTSWALAFNPNGAAPDHAALATPYCTFDGANTDWLFYQGQDGAGSTNLCVASAPHNPAGTGQNTIGWTRSASNPILTLGGAGSYDAVQINFPQVVVDRNEPHPAKRWKMLYTAEDQRGVFRVAYATAPAPQGPWAKQGVAINVGGVGANDQIAAYAGPIVSYGGSWYAFYEGHDAAGAGHVMWATGLDLASLVKQGTLFTPDNVSQALTTDLNSAPGRSVTVASTAGYRKDAAVILSASSNMDVYSTSRIRKVVSATQLELYHGLTGFPASYPARIRQITSSPNLTPRVAAFDGSTWWFIFNFWEPFINSSDSASSYNALLEEGYLFQHSAAAPTGARPVAQDLPYLTSRGFNSDQESFENMTLLNVPR